MRWAALMALLVALADCGDGAPSAAEERAWQRFRTLEDRFWRTVQVAHETGECGLIDDITEQWERIQRQYARLTPEQQANRRKRDLVWTGPPLSDCPNIEA